MNIFTILLLIFSLPNKLDKQLNIFCNTLISQMKTIYNKDQDETNLIINNNETNNKENINVINTKNIDIDNNKELSSKTKNKNININDNKEISIENSKIDNNNNDKIGTSTIKNIKEFGSDSSQRDIKTTYTKNKKNFKEKNDVKDINPMDMDSTSRAKIKNEINNNILSALDNINKDEIKSNYDIEDEQKKIDELRKEQNSNLYIFYVIKFIPYKKRKKYISELEMVNLSYDYALKMEDRNKSDFYFSLLREKNKIISIFLNDKDFNIQTVKIALFIFNFNLSLTVNALFFTDEAIYQINQDEGSFKLSTQISRIIYSAVISAVISFLVELLAFTHKSIIKLRYYKDIKIAEDRVPILIRILKIKIMVFFIIIIFFDIIFLYYITVFCSVYSIIQIHMINDSLISFLLTNSYSVILSMLSSFIRIFSLKKKSSFRYLLYLISWIISLI